MHALFAMNALLAQRGNQPNDADVKNAFMMIFLVYGVIILVAIGIQVMFLLSMSKCLKQVSSRNRRMEPGQVWLCLIPIFGFIWTIIMILKVSDSLRDEFDDRGIRGDGDFGKTLGIVYIVSAFICGPVALICFIMYWVKIAGYTKQMQSRGGSYDDDYDDEDDRPRKKKRKPRDDDYEDDEDDDDDRGRRR